MTRPFVDEEEGGQGEHQEGKGQHEESGGVGPAEDIERHHADAEA